MTVTQTPTELVLTRGLPGSGKTYFAERWVAEDPQGRARVNRDDLRAHLYAGEGVLEREQENTITKVQQAAVIALLRAGKSVVVDDTHLRRQYVMEWKKIADKWGVRIRVEDFTDVPVHLCIQRDADRYVDGGRHVGEEVIAKMASRLKSMPPLDLEPAAPAEPIWQYASSAAGRAAYIFDIDGTLALMDGRSPYDHTRVKEDLLNEHVARMTYVVKDAGYDVVLLSGREDKCREDTEWWLGQHRIPYAELFMRETGDSRNDAIIKLEIFREKVAPKYEVYGVFDDRDRVVEMWRSIGLLCMQVAEGDF